MIDTKTRVQLAFGVALSVLVLIYGFAVEPYWIEVTQHNPSVDKKVGLRVVQISDLHMQTFGMREDAVIATLHELRPDVVVFTGDVIDKPDSIEAFREFVSKIPDVHRVGVLGNWEYWSDADLQQLKLIYESRQGSRLLVNETVDYVIKNKRLRVVGLDDFTAGYPSLPWEDSLPEGAVSLVLEHSPGFFEAKKLEAPLSRRYDLCLSGHTHSGQITFFGVPLWTPRGSGHYKSGLYQTPNCPLYVSRGIGTSLVSMRLGARPEVAVFDF